MLEAFLKIIDRLITLRNIEQNRRKELFEKILEPVFNDLLLVHGDYLEMFLELERGLSNSHEINNKTSDILERLRNNLKEKRSQFEPVRVKLREFINALNETKLCEEEEYFLYSVVSYFPKGKLIEHFTASTYIISKIDAILDGISDTEELEYYDDGMKLSLIENAIRLTINEQKDNWSNACVNFAKLKIKIASL